MISSKKSITPQERKDKVANLRLEHEDYFQTIGNINAAYIPKMAYRPSGKDELYISFFPSELEKECDVYTEFVSIIYESEDPKRTLYLHKFNPHWEEEYELVESRSGFQRHLVPVGELKVINDVTTRNVVEEVEPLEPLTPIAPPINLDIKELVKVLEDINYTLQTISHTIKRM